MGVRNYLKEHGLYLGSLEKKYLLNSSILARTFYEVTINSLKKCDFLGREKIIFDNAVDFVEQLQRVFEFKSLRPSDYCFKLSSFLGERNKQRITKESGEVLGLLGKLKESGFNPKVISEKDYLKLESFFRFLNRKYSQILRLNEEFAHK